MHILIAGATGLIGRALVKQLEADHSIYVLGRNLDHLKQTFPKHTALDWATIQTNKNYLDNIDVIINLCGENIGAGRWTKKRKALIISSRTETTEILAKACAASANQNIRLLNASAIGVYGLKNDDTQQTWNYVDESSLLPTTPSDFLATVGKAWENALCSALDANISIVQLRFGVVLSTEGGALKKMLPPFKLGLGGRIGMGQQPFSWVSLTDVIRAITWIIDHPQIKGPVNIVAPEILSQKAFAHALAAALNRPALIPLPHWLLKLQFGQMGTELLLQGTAVNAAVLKASGFEFEHASIQKYLINNF